MTSGLSKTLSWFLFKVTQATRYTTKIIKHITEHVDSTTEMNFMTKKKNCTIVCYVQKYVLKIAHSLRGNMQTEVLTHKELGHNDFLLHNKTKDW
jgi:hypothetical protein